MKSKKKERKLKVFVAMSGGVDSSVAAALLKKQGYNVIGVFMRPWSPDLQQTTHNKRQKKIVSHQSLGSCMWQQDREDAMRVAAKLGIPLLTWDFSKEYKKEVADYMIREYKAGRTPNPDVMCNKHIKFSLFLKKALKEGADYIATGHYVRLRRTSKKLKVLKVHKGLYKLYKPDELYNYHLLKAKDKNKDQSYFLWTLTQEQLKYCLFPIGDHNKPEVRKMAKKFGLPTADKKDSQGVCFIGPLDMKMFLKSYIKPKSGKILDTKGIIVGRHDGVFYYTIGQRHGLDIKNGQGPYYVVKKDVIVNTLVVARSADDGPFLIKETLLANVNFIDNKIYSQILENLRISGEKVLVRTRYRQPLVRADLVYKSKSVHLLFEKLQKAVAPGQSAVFYRGQELLGGGIMV